MPGRFETNMRALVHMAQYSRATLQGMRAELGIEYSHLERGILAFYRDPRELEHARHSAALMRELGVDRRDVDADEVVRIEPALAGLRGGIVGGDYTAEDESGDVHASTCALAARARDAGVVFRYDTQLSRLVAGDGRVSVAEVIEPDGWYRPLHADAYVVALGNFSPDIVNPLGISFPVYPAKGYSATSRVVDQIGRASGRERVCKYGMI